MRLNKYAAVPTFGLALTAAAAAQVTYGTDLNTGDENFSYSINAGTTTGPLFSGQEMYGLADDDPNMLLYLSEEGDVFSWTYGSMLPPALVVSPVDPANGNSIRCEAMYHTNGTLFGVDEFGAAGQEGIYSFDLVTGDATPVLIYANTLLDIGGMDVDPTTGLVYGSSDASAARGVVELDTVNLTETILSPYPGTLSDIDGLACQPSVAGGAGAVVHLIQDEPADIDIYDVASNTYTGTYPSSVAGARIFSAGTWTDGLGDGGIGTNYCMANPNSTGQTGLISATGSDVAADNNVTLMATQLPPNAFGFFLASQTQGFVMNPSGSEGNICLGGAIGRYVGPGQIMNSGAAGEITLMIDTTMIPNGTTFDTAMSGDTFFFQLWHRDTNMGASVSNFTDGLQIDFQ